MSTVMRVCTLNTNGTKHYYKIILFMSLVYMWIISLMIRDAFMYAQKQIKQNKVCLHICTYTALFQSTQICFICSSNNFTTHIFNMVCPCIQAFLAFIHTLCFRVLSYIRFTYIYVTTTDTETCAKSVDLYAIDTLKILKNVVYVYVYTHAEHV